MLQQIQNSFAAQTYILGQINPWLLAVIGISLMLLAIFFIRFLLDRKQHYIPYGSVTDPRQIRSLLRLAIDQRSPLELQIISSEEVRRPTVRGTILSMDDTFIQIELAAIQALSSHWIGRTLRIFFRLKLEGEFTYFTFLSSILSTSNTPEKICFVTIAIPSTLENRQKRAFLRLAPPVDLVLGAAVWHGPELPPLNEFNNINSWPDPTLLYVPKTYEQFRFIDISAGGLRLFIPRKTLKELNEEFHVIEHLIVLLDLLDPELNKRLRIWTHCRIQNAWEEPVSRNLLLGVQFIAWGKAKESAENIEDKGAIDWFKMSTSYEIESIGNWIMRRHLELFRDLPTPHD